LVKTTLLKPRGGFPSKGLQWRIGPTEKIEDEMRHGLAANFEAEARINAT